MILKLYFGMINGLMRWCWRISLLFYLVVNKMSMVWLKCIRLDEGGETWNYRRRLLAWEEEQVREYSDILTNIILHSIIPNRWLWLLHSSKKYNLTSAYNYMMSSVNVFATEHSNAIWNKEVPLKVSLVAWRLLRNCLPTTNNWIQISFHQLCAGDCDKMEDIDHLFLSCDFFRHLWHDIANWLGFSTMPPEHVSDHFLQFENLGGTVLKPSQLATPFMRFWSFMRVSILKIKKKITKDKNIPLKIKKKI